MIDKDSCRRGAPLIMILLVLVLLVWSSSLRGGEVFPLPELEKPSLLKISGRRMYIIDQYQVKVFSLENRKLLQVLGKRGGGPGEFSSRPDSLQITGGRIFCSAPFKLVRFNLDGSLAGEVNTGKSIRRLKRIDRETYTGIQLVAGKTGITDFRLGIYNQAFELMKVLNQRIYETKNATIDLFIRFEYSPYDLDTAGGNVIIADLNQGLKMNIIDREGRPVRFIQRAYEPVKFTEEDKKTVITGWEASGRPKTLVDIYKLSVSFPDHYPPVCTWKTAGDSLYIITFKTVNRKNECLVYDLGGRFIKSVYVPLRGKSKILYHWYPYDFYQNRFYQLFDNYERETWELRITDLL